MNPISNEAYDILYFSTSEGIKAACETKRLVTIEDSAGEQTIRRFMTGNINDAQELNLKFPLQLALIKQTHFRYIVY